MVVAPFLMALMSKPNAMTLPFFLLLLDYWPLERMRANPRSIWLLLLEKAPLFALSAAFVFLRSGRGVASARRKLRATYHPHFMSPTRCSLVPRTFDLSHSDQRRTKEARKQISTLNSSQQHVSLMRRHSLV